MTYEQYWDGEPLLPKYYREAERLRAKRRNQEMWLQGMYVYEAICDASPILHDFAKRGTKPHPYSKEPYAIYDTESDRARTKEVRQKQTFEKGKTLMTQWMEAHNARMKGREKQT